MSNLLKQAQQHFAAGEYAAAEALLHKALRKQNLASIARKMMADCLYNQGMMHAAFSGMFEEAEKCFVTALRYNPLHTLSLNNLGVLKDRAGALDEALAYYSKAVDADPRHLKSLRNLAVCYQRLTRYDDAEILFKRLATIDPANAGLYLMRQAMLIRSIVPDLTYPDQIRQKINDLLDECLRSKPIAIPPETYAAPYFYLSYHGRPNRALHKKIA